MRFLLSMIVALSFFLAGAFARGQASEDYERPPISYSTSKPKDAIARLQAQLAAGHLSLGHDDREMLQTLLRELRIPPESQVLVYSKTSFQRQRIRPEHPRALYFNETCYVGWVPSGLIEIVDIDPVIGPVFYSLNPGAYLTNSPKALARDSNCLQCHGGTFVRGIPGIFTRSVFTDDSGDPLLRQGSEVVDLSTPFTNRWGGWYVTGKHGNTLHRGNVFAQEINDQLKVDFRPGANVTNLSGFFDVGLYLTNTSDIIALLVLEQQTDMQNVLTKASLNCRRMLDYQENLQRAFKEPLTQEPSYDSVKSVFESSALELVDHLLFKNEADLPPDLEGSPGFQQAFKASAARIAGGLSLKDLSLRGHLFNNRCSYLIYSDAFRLLPEPLKHRVFERLSHALRPIDSDPRYAYLPADERARILEILRQTDDELKTAFNF
jgi:hypothetical protein